MIPISDENPTLRTPIVTIALLITLGAVWIFFQGAGFDGRALALSVCKWGLIPGEITKLAPIGLRVPIAERLACVVNPADPSNILTPLTSMFLHGGWMHLLGNCLFLWVFGNNVEDSMGRLRFLIFYLLCGVGAAAAQVAASPGSPVPMVGASGAISGVLGAYLVLYPRVRVRVLIPIFVFLQIISLPAYLVLLLWIGLQLVNALLTPDVASGVALWAHIGGFAAGLVLVKFFENRELVTERSYVRRRSHSDRY